MHFCLGYVGSMTKKDFMIYMTILSAHPDVHTLSLLNQELHTCRIQSMALSLPNNILLWERVWRERVREIEPAVSFLETVASL
jgi:hypothetical protein